MRSRNSENYVAVLYRALIVGGGGNTSWFATTPEATHVRRRFRNSFSRFPGTHLKMGLRVFVRKTLKNPGVYPARQNILNSEANSRWKPTKVRVQLATIIESQMMKNGASMQKRSTERPRALALYIMQRPRFIHGPINLINSPSIRYASRKSHEWSRDYANTPGRSPIPRIVPPGQERRQHAAESLSARVRIDFSTSHLSSRPKDPAE